MLWVRHRPLRRRGSGLDLSKIVVTLYDVFGYLLPGYVVLVACSIIEATFVGTPFLSLSFFGSHPLQFAVVAYFLGHVSHSIASWISGSERGRALLRTSPKRMNAELCAAARSELNVAYGLNEEVRDALTRLEVYMLADAYLVAAGASAERDLLVTREGFFKQSVLAADPLSRVGGAAPRPHGWRPCAAARVLPASPDPDLGRLRRPSHRERDLRERLDGTDRDRLIDRREQGLQGAHDEAQRLGVPSSERSRPGRPGLGAPRSLAALPQMPRSKR